MERPSYSLITSNGTSQAIPLDRYVNGYAVGIGFSKTTMTATYTLQYSLLDPFRSIMRDDAYTSSYKVSGQWKNTDDTSLVSATTPQTASFPFVPRAIRVITSNVSGGTLTLSVIPTGMDGN